MPDRDELPGNLSPTIKIGGSQLPAGDFDALTELRVELELNVPARVTLHFLADQLGRAGQSDDLQGSWGLDSRFALGEAVSVAVPNAATGQSNTVFTGEVTQIDWQIHQGSPPEVVLVAHDKAHRLGRATKVATYASMSLADILRKAVGATGLTFSASGVKGLTVIQDYMLQQSTVLTLLNDAVERFGGCWAMDSEGTKLEAFPWGKPRGSTVTFDTSRDLLDLNVRGSSRADSFKVTDFDLSQVKPLTASSTSSPVSTSAGLQDATNHRNLGALKMQASHLAVQTQAEADALAQGLHVRASAGTLVARGTTVGPASALLPGGGVKFTSGGPVDGTFFVNRVEHVYRRSTGVRTRFVAGDRTPGGLADLVSAPPAVTSMGHHDSLVLGIVTNNKDPENRWRVKVKLPGLSEDDESQWAPVVSVGAGQERGVAFMPEVSDVVVVGFERGDTRRPLVLGGVYTSKANALPVDLDAGKKVMKRSLSSRTGHLIEFGDGPDGDKSYVVVELAGKQIFLRLAKDKVVLQSPQTVPITVQSGQASIALDSNKITMQALEINLKAQTKVSIQGVEVEVKAETNATVEGQAQVDVKGGLANVQATGPLALKGAIVQVN
jgi:hypothetical protein